MGAHEEQGKTQNILRQEMHMKKQIDNLAGEEYGWTQLQMLLCGATALGRTLFPRAARPYLIRAYLSCAANISKQLKEDIVHNANGKDCLSYRAFNLNTHTENHLDSGDHERGVAGLQISGDFMGGEFVLRDDRKMFELPPGLQRFVRGPIQRHCTRAWSGDSKFCRVMTVKHSVWLDYPPNTGLQKPEVDEKGPKKKTEARLTRRKGSCTVELGLVGDCERRNSTPRDERLGKMKKAHR